MEATVKTTAAVERREKMKRKMRYRNWMRKSSVNWWWVFDGDWSWIWVKRGWVKREWAKIAKERGKRSARVMWRKVLGDDCGMFTDSFKTSLSVRN